MILQLMLFEIYGFISKMSRKDYLVGKERILCTEINYIRKEQTSTVLNKSERRL